MIFEGLAYLFTSTAPSARRFGFAGESVSIMSRYGRCKADWEPHLRNSRDVVRKAIAQCRRKRRAVILGAGLGYDLPLADLLDAFEEVWLVDLVFGPAIRWQAFREPRLRLLPHDVTESIAGLAEGNLTAAAPSRFLDDGRIDLATQRSVVMDAVA